MEKRNGYLILPVIAGVLWGTSGIFVRTLSAYGMDPQTMLLTRVAMGTVIMAIALLIYDRELLKVKIRDIGLMIGCAITGTLGLNICYVRAIEDLSLSLAAVLLSLSPVFVIFMAAVLFKEKLTKSKLFFTALALAGCLMVSGILEADGLRWTWIGIFLGLGSAVFYAMYSIVSKMTMHRGYGVLTIIFYSMFIVVLALLPFADWGITIKYISEKPVVHILFLVVYALCTSILPSVIFTFALKHAEAGKVSILASGGEPVAAAIMGMLVFGEMPTVLSAIGLVVTIVALGLLCYNDSRETTLKELPDNREAHL